MTKMKRRKGTPPNCELRKRTKADGITKSLPLVHVTAVGLAREIVAARQLQTRTCPVFKKELLYFFALKPAFRVKDGDEKSHQINRFPFVFVVKAEAVTTPHHVYPFDTGAAEKGVFKGADPYVYLEDYELAPNHEAVAGHIGWAFGDTQAYFDGDLRQEVLEGVPDFETVTRGYIDIARMPAAGSNQPDDRAAAIEVASSQHVRLKDNVLLAIVPRRYLEDGTENENFLKKLADEGIAYETYEWQPNLTPNSFRDEISAIVRKFYDGPPSRW